jgi:RNA recognition motif-containing protein
VPGSGGTPGVCFVSRGEDGVWSVAKRIYVGNLPFRASEDEVRELFERHGAVQSVTLVTDRATGRPRGFGFVEMDDDQAEAAIEALNGTDFGGRSLRVNVAREREGFRRNSRPDSGGGGGNWLR